MMQKEAPKKKLSPFYLLRIFSGDTGTTTRPCAERSGSEN